MNLKKVLILSIAGLVLWATWGSEVNAKTDTDKEKVEEFVTEYFEAHTAEGIETLSDYVEDAESVVEEIMAFKVSLEWGAEKYDNIKVITYPLSNEMYWYVTVSYELIVKDFDIGLPGARTLVVRKQKDGSFVIVYDVLSMDDGENEKLLEEIRQINLSDEVCDMNNVVGAAYNDILVQNPDILEWVQDLSYAIDLARAENYSGQENEEAADMRGTYVVREGDCLWSIAEEELGDGMQWSSIYEANCELIGDDPNLIYAGWELEMDVPIETVYTDESCKEITIGDISCNVRKFHHVAKVVEEENQTTFFAEADSEPDEPGFFGPQQITYIVRKEPELPDSYEEAVEYFEGIGEFRNFESYQTADDNKIRVLHKAVRTDGEKAYYLVGVSGEDGLYFIETEDILLDNHLQVQYGRNNPFVEEYCYTVSDVKCGRNYTDNAQIEKKIYYEEMRAEYRVTSDRLNYTAEFSAVPSEDDESKLVNTLNVTLEDDQYKVPAVQWISDGLTRSDYPEFRDMNADGYLDLLCYAYTPDSSSRSMEIIFVWDKQEGEYVQASKVGGPEEYGWPDTFESPYERDGMVDEWHYEYEGDIRKTWQYVYEWKDNQLVLIVENKSNYIFDAATGVYVEEESPNPYAHLDTFSSAYLYDIYEAGKESTADGDWFVDGSERFTYYEVYDPLGDEHLSAEWEIELAEMKGTDKLAQAVNEYHAELFEDQREWMQEKQDTVMAMDVEEYRSGKNGRRDGNNIRTMASFEWGNIFTVVDMKNTFHRGCCPIIANFNKTTGEKYEFTDLFNTDDYNAKLLELIRYRYDGYVNNWGMDLESESFSFMITNQGLLVINDYPPRSLLFDWIELEDILNREVCNELGIDTGWKDLGSPNKVISYDFFSNANQWHYNLNYVMLAAEVICAHIGDNIEEGTWELRDMHIRDTENGRILNFVACAEDGTRELYMLMDETRETGPQYLVMADVKVSKYGDVSYDSDLHWEPYGDRMDFPEKYSEYSIYADRDACVYESVYLDASINAMADYLASVQADKDIEWWLLGDLVFIDENGLLADVCFSNGFQRVHMMVDRDSRNRQYSIVEVYSAQDTKYFSAELAEQEQTKWDDLYDIEGTEANFFDNAYRFRYNPQIFKAAACAVKDYAEKIDLADEDWELIRIYSEDGAVGVIARTTSLSRRLSLLIKGNTYQVIADVQKGDSGASELSDGFSYDSEMKWHSYYEWTINGEKEHESVYTVRCNDDYYRHDSIYEYQLHRAMQEYLSSINADIEEEWEILPEKLSVGCHGSLADAWYTNGNCRVHLVVDVWNKTYTVIVGEEIFI